MPKRTYRKLDIAHDYLTVAAELYFAERYFPALSLAAMAEEIFEAVMRARNVPGPRNTIGLRFVPYRFKPVSEDLIAVARQLNPALRDEKNPTKIYRLLYKVKNSAKHGLGKGGRGFNLSIECDPELEAWSMLGRAVENLIRLHYEPQGAVRQFFQAYQAGRKTWHDRGSSEGPHAKSYELPKREPWK